MSKTIYQKFIFILLIAGALFSFAFAPLAMAGDNYGLEDTMKEGVLKKALQQEKPEVIIGGLVGGILSLVGVLFLCLMIYGGLTWMLAHGNEQQVEKAKGIIIAAVFGLVIVLSAYAITAFVGQQLTNTGS